MQNIARAKALLALLVTSGCASAGRTDIDGSDAGACPTGLITFEFRRAPGAVTDYCIGAPDSCSRDWLEITSPAGATVAIDAPCLADCSSCEPVGCPAICALPSAMKADGERRTWDGAYFTRSMCGQGLACVAPDCATAGRYVARMCAYAEAVGESASLCAAAPSPTCVSVPFDWPPLGGSATVTGSIGERDDGGTTEAGACCPVTWSMYPCAYPDGGTGQACHNPAMGCASSQVCGEGCDQIVVGRCDAP